MELQVLAAILDGLTTDKALAQHFGVSRSTIQTHLVHIYRKVNVRSRTELVLKVLDSPGILFDR